MKKLLFIAVAFGMIFSFYGCSGGGLKVDRFIFCSQINGDRDFVEKTDKTFLKGEESVLVYAEVSGFRFSDISGVSEYWPTVEVEVKDSSGNTVVGKQKIIDEKLTPDSTLTYLYFSINLPLPSNIPQGKYTMTVYFKDNYSGNSVTYEDTFNLVEKSAGLLVN